MSSHNQSQRDQEVGANGGNVPTTGMTWQQAQQTDRDVNHGKKDASR